MVGVLQVALAALIVPFYKALGYPANGFPGPIIRFRPLVQWIDSHLRVTKPVMTCNLQLELF